jgi:hypothetical protein
LAVVSHNEASSRQAEEIISTFAQIYLFSEQNIQILTIVAFENPAMTQKETAPCQHKHYIHRYNIN